MHLANCSLLIMSPICELPKSVAKALVAQLCRIHHLLVSLLESAVKFVFHDNDIKVRLNSLEKKVQELQDLVSKSHEKSNQELERMRESVKEEMAKEMMPTAAQNINNKSGEMRKRISSISELLDMFLFGSEDEQTMFEALCCKWKINNVDQMELEKDYLSDMFPIHGYDFKVQLKLKFNSYRSAQFSFCMRYIGGLELYMHGNNLPIVTTILKDCSGRKNKRHVLDFVKYFVTDVNPFYLSDSWLPIMERRLDKLISPSSKSMEVLFLLNPPTFFNWLHSTDGTLTNTIPYFREKLGLEHMSMEGHWSPSFLTHPGGYRVFVRLGFICDFADFMPELVASVHFLPIGNLPWEINHKVTIKLVHPHNKSKDIVTYSQMNYACYHEMHIEKISQIVRNDLISNNSLKYEVKIEPIM